MNLTMTIHERASTGTGDRMNRVRRDSTKWKRSDQQYWGMDQARTNGGETNRIYSYQKEQPGDYGESEYEYSMHFINPKGGHTRTQWQESGFAQGR